MKTKRIGIYAGSFDPVHAGHVTFALQALQAAQLDELYFVPERQPRGKQGVEHFGHRVAMLKRALQPHPQCEVLETVDVNLNVARTLPRLQQEFPDAQLVFLFGSEVAQALPDWPNVAQLLSVAELVIGVRDEADRHRLKTCIGEWPQQPHITLIESYAPEVSSDAVRSALYQRKPQAGLLKSVERYSDRNWLYVSVN